jgi:3-phenylpropionate/trans-cinnamate dioxygenase ferredoxin subunit
MAEATLVRACRVDELTPGAAYVIPGDNPVAVFNADGTFYAIDDTCSHARFSLSEGDLAGETVECVMHTSRFCLRTGRALTPPATRAVRTYPVTVIDGEIYVDLT